MKLHEAVFDAVSGIDEKMLEHSERPQRSFALHWAQAAGLLVLVFCLVLIPHLHGMGAPASGAQDAKHEDSAYETAAASTNCIFTDELTGMLEEGKTVLIRITVTENAGQAYETLYGILKEAGISAEITEAGLQAEMNAADLGRIVWPEEYTLYFEAVREEK